MSYRSEWIDMKCERCGNPKMNLEGRDYFCSRCGFVHTEFREPEQGPELVTMIEDGKGGYRKCLN